MKLPTIVSNDRCDAKAEKLLTVDQRDDFELALAAAPEAHPVVPGLNGVRKARFGAQSRGKQGGVRVIYFYAISREIVYLLGIYAKNEREDLTNDQKKAINKAVEELKAAF